eukprot:TRINITY_DN1999_c0_g1_i11.p1 TRINITY_DN1999_c0_g1~~TRINITY_DN1999_c0_g1_i11.p1  ORF type:complete len:180 (+),score=14.63 TRINITY_DN1999_c0_g1_i11:181-720(+)
MCCIFYPFVFLVCFFFDFFGILASNVRLGTKFQYIRNPCLIVIFFKDSFIRINLFMQDNSFGRSDYLLFLVDGKKPCFVGSKSYRYLFPHHDLLVFRSNFILGYFAVFCFEFMVFAMNTFGGISIQGNRVIGRMAMGLGNVLNISGKEAAKIIRHRVIASCAKAVAHQLLMQKVHTEPG